MFASGYIALNRNDKGNVNAFDNTNQKIIQSLKQANKKVIESAKTTITTFKIQTKQFKLQQIQTKALTQISGDIKDLVRIMKDNNQEVSYSKVTDKAGNSINQSSRANVQQQSSGLVGARYGLLKGGLVGGVAGGVAAMGKKLFGAKGLVGKLTRFATKAVIFTKIIDIGYNIFNSYKKAGEYFNTEFPTMSQKISAGIGGALESLTFGFIDAKKTAKTINKYTTFIVDFFDGALKWIKSSNVYKFLAKKAKVLANSDVVKYIKKTGSETKEYWANTSIGKSLKDTYNQTTSFWSNFYQDHFGDKKLNKSQIAQLGRTARAIRYGDKVKLGGSKSWRDNNPGNITGISGLKYGAIGIAHSKYGDRGDQKQLIFATREDGVRAFDQLIRDRYTGGSIKSKFAKYQTKGFDSKLRDWQRAGIDTNKDIKYYMENEPDMYKKFREIMFRHEGEIPGKVKNANEINYRDIHRYHLDPDSVRSFKVLTGVL